MPLIIRHLKPKIRGKIPIEIIGVPHGYNGKPMPKTANTALKAILEKSNGKLYSEGQPDEGIVPPEYLHQTEPLEHELIDLLAQNVGLNIWHKYPSYRQFVEESDNPKRDKQKTVVLTTPYSRHDERKGLASIDYTNDPLFHFTATVRSAFMAGRLIQLFKIHKTPITALVGEGHATQIHRFLENPRLAIKYLKAIRATVEKSHYQNEPPRMHELILSFRTQAQEKETPLKDLFDETIRQFEKLLPKPKKKTN